MKWLKIRILFYDINFILGVLKIIDGLLKLYVRIVDGLCVELLFFFEVMCDFFFFKLVVV